MKETQGSQIIAGPPYKNVGPFEWATSAFMEVPHWCLPEEYEFPWIEVRGDGSIQGIGWEYDDSYV